MSRVSRIAAACVCAATMATAAPAFAVPAEPIVDAKSATKAKQARKATAVPAPTAAAKIKRTALSVVGAPYSYGGTSPAGFDCSGFTSWVYSHVGITLPHSSSAQYSLAGSDGFTRIDDIEDLQIGDLVFHATGGSGIGHVGIYIGDGSFVSATSSEGIQVRSLFDSYWGPLWVGAVRVSA
ncbi:MAG: C40 family peptidase [Actinobacteria bacterium]|nr:C40 family peptidase [Actinomycetota bacterium]